MSRRDRKKEITKNNILECALKLYHSKGFTDTSMDEIAGAADISRGTLYNYFPDKEHILVLYFQQKLLENRKKLDTDILAWQGFHHHFDKVFDLVFETFLPYRELATIYFGFRIKQLATSGNFMQEDLPKRGFEDLILNVITTAQKHHEIRSDIPASIIARTFQMVFLSFFIPAMFHAQTVPWEQHKTQILDIVFNGIKVT